MLNTSTTTTTPDEWLTLAEAGPVARVSIATLRREIQRGALRHARIGGRKLIRIRRSWISEWLESSSTPVR